jgi:hypothetical protein
MLWGNGAGAFEKGIFGQSYGCHPPAYINELYTSLLRKLRKQDPFLAFDALSLLIGDRNARFFCQNRLGFSTRPPLQ